MIERLRATRAQLRAVPAWRLVVGYYVLATATAAVFDRSHAAIIVGGIFAVWICLLILRGKRVLTLLSTQIVVDLILRTMGVHGPVKNVLTGIIVVIYTVTVIERSEQTDMGLTAYLRL